MYEEYIKNPLITKQRIFYETMEEVLPGAKLIIDDGTTQKLLPLEAFDAAAKSTDSAVSQGTQSAEAMTATEEN